MSDFLLTDLGTVPVSLNYRTLTLVGTDLYIGDATNNPIKIGPIADTHITDVLSISAITNVDSPYAPGVPAFEVLITVDASGGAVTVNLPTVANWSNKVIRIKKIDSSANAVTINANGTETIDGAASQSLAAQYDSINITSDGVNAWII